MKRTLPTLAALLLSATFAAQANAQQPATQPQQGATAPQQAPMQKPDLAEPSAFSDQDLEAFADAQKEMGKIQQHYSEQLQSRKEQPKQAMEVQRKAQQEMVQAVKDSGLELRTYNQMAQLAQYDADFRTRIQEKM